MYPHLSSAPPSTIPSTRSLTSLRLSAHKSAAIRPAPWGVPAYLPTYLPYLTSPTCRPNAPRGGEPYTHACVHVHMCACAYCTCVHVQITCPRSLVSRSSHPHGEGIYASEYIYASAYIYASEYIYALMGRAVGRHIYVLQGGWEAYICTTGRLGGLSAPSCTRTHARACMYMYYRAFGRSLSAELQLRRHQYSAAGRPGWG